MAASYEEWIATTEPWQRTIVEAVRALVAEVEPGLEIAIKWSQPVWSRGGPVMYAKPFKKAVNVGFWRGVELEDPAGVLEGTGDMMRHLKVAPGQAIDRAALAALVRQAVALNREKGDPTRKANR